MRHKEIKLPTAQCDVIEETSCSSTSWERVREDRWKERGACTQRCVCVCVCVCVYVCIYIYIYKEQQKRAQKWLKQQQL